jgi:hypothetical protein
VGLNGTSHSLPQSEQIALYIWRGPDLLGPPYLPYAILNTPFFRIQLEKQRGCFQKLNVSFFNLTNVRLNNYTVVVSGFAAEAGCLK